MPKLDANIVRWILDDTYHHSWRYAEELAQNPELKGEMADIWMERAGMKIEGHSARAYALGRGCRLVMGKMTSLQRERWLPKIWDLYKDLKKKGDQITTKELLIVVFQVQGVPARILEEVAEAKEATPWHLLMLFNQENVTEAMVLKWLNKWGSKVRKEIWGELDGFRDQTMSRFRRIPEEFREEAILVIEDFYSLANIWGGLEDEGTKGKLLAQLSTKTMDPEVMAFIERMDILLKPEDFKDWPRDAIANLLLSPNKEIRIKGQAAMGLSAPRRPIGR